MARSTASWLSSRRLLTISVAACIVLSVLPTGATRWVRWLGNIAELVINPIQHPIASLVRSVQGPPATLRSDDPAVAQLTLERDRATVRIHQLEAEIARLARMIEELSRGLAINPDLPLTQIPAQVVGTAGDATWSILKLSVGAADNVKVNDVATVQGVHLVGRVRDVAARTCRVLAFTHPSSGHVEGVIMFDGDIRGPVVMLTPRGDGTLEGPLGLETDQLAPPDIRPGMVVRLADETWPQHARGLILGRVEDVRRAPNQRPLIRVAPEIQIGRVSQVVVRGLADRTPTAPGGAR